MRRTLAFRPLWPSWLRWCICCLSLAWLQTAHALPPSLAIQILDPETVQLTWTNAATGYLLQQTTALSPITLWEVVPQIPLLQGNQYSLTLGHAGNNTFFRLRQP